MAKSKGRVTIPTDMDVVKETLEIMNEWGADAIRDCDGTEFPQELRDTGAKVYATYYTTRKDNAWAKANPDEIFRGRKNGGRDHYTRNRHCSRTWLSGNCETHS